MHGRTGHVGLPVEGDAITGPVAPAFAGAPPIGADAPAVGGFRRWWGSRVGAPLLLEILICAALLAIYKGARLVARGDVDVALDNARRVIDVERALGVFNEEAVQRLALNSVGFIKFLNAYYLYAHFAVTIAFLVWLYVRHPFGYLSARRVLVVVTFVGLLGHALYPLAPPRMLDGFVDTARVFGPSSYGDGGAYGGLANQFAAMPSLHFAWAVVVAWGMWRFSKSHWRFVGVLHPILTLAAIVLTANHYWIDAFFGLLLVPIGIVADRVMPRWKRRVLVSEREYDLAAAERQAEITATRHSD
ncbi:MAG: inositol phosphorylceramide synthase [Actinobacteria bacterium]|nr:inositol phosphorylceramide synthase [Actinomycetota bacterium]